jgi:hypothetical protein
VNANVRERGGRVPTDERLDNNRRATLSGDRQLMRESGAAHDKRYSMAAGIARLEAERVAVRMRLEGVVRVCGKPVVVLGMVVVRVLVGVECRHRAGK